MGESERGAAGVSRAPVLLGTTRVAGEVYGQHMRTISTVFTSIILASAFSGVMGSAEPPVVTSVSPSPIVMSPKPQPLKVTGTGFARGLTVEVTLQGNTETFSGAAVRSQASTSFEISAVLAQPGAATLVVRNTDGGVSDPFPLRVEAGQPVKPEGPAPQSTPVIDRVIPEKVNRSSVAQLLTFSGNSFVQGLSVSVTDPTGSVTLIRGSAIESITPEVVKVNLVLEILGEYTFLITNPSGRSSNSVVVTVSASGG